MDILSNEKRELWLSLKVKGRGQFLNTMKPNIIKMARDREKVSMKLDRKSCMGSRMTEIFFCDL